MQQTAPWRILIKASLMGVIVAWLIYAVGAAIDVFGTGPSHDIAVAFYPAATMIALVVALLLFWPLAIGMSRIGNSLGARQRWASTWWAWTAVGAVVGAAALVLLMGVLSSWSAENMLVAAIGGGVGAVTAFVTRWRIGILQKG